MDSNFRFQFLLILHSRTSVGLVRGYEHVLSDCASEDPSRKSFKYSIVVTPEVDAKSLLLKTLRTPDTGHRNPWTGLDLKTSFMISEGTMWACKGREQPAVLPRTDSYERHSDGWGTAVLGCSNGTHTLAVLSCSLIWLKTHPRSRKVCGCWKPSQLPKAKEVMYLGWEHRTNTLLHQQNPNYTLNIILISTEKCSLCPSSQKLLLCKRMRPS